MIDRLKELIDQLSASPPFTTKEGNKIVDEIDSIMEELSEEDNVYINIDDELKSYLKSLGHLYDQRTR